MDLTTACETAAMIDAQCEAATVIAIGRFLPPDAITPAAPWKVSVQIAGDERLKVIATVSDAATLRQSQQDQQQRAAAGFLF